MRPIGRGQGGGPHLQGRSASGGAGVSRLAGRRAAPKGERRPLPRTGRGHRQRRRAGQARRPPAGRQPGIRLSDRRLWSGRTGTCGPMERAPQCPRNRARSRRQARGARPRTENRREMCELFIGHQPIRMLFVACVAWSSSTRGSADPTIVHEIVTRLAMIAPPR